MTYTFNKELFQAWEIEKDTKYAIPDPGDNLIEIYEIDTIKDALLLRAEKWESPEHKYEPINSSGSSSSDKKPLNVQNPNYTELLDNIRAIQKQSNDLKKNKKDLKGLKEIKDNKAPDLVGINKKEKLVEEINQKLQKSWTKFVAFVQNICEVMDLSTPLEPLGDFSTSSGSGSLGGNQPKESKDSNSSHVKTIQIYKFEQISSLEHNKNLPEIRFLRYLLQRKEPKIDIEIVSLICSYLYAKYVTI